MSGGLSIWLVSQDLSCTLMGNKGGMYHALYHAYHVGIQNTRAGISLQSRTKETRGLGMRINGLPRDSPWIEREQPLRGCDPRISVQNVRMVTLSPPYAFWPASSMIL